MASEDFNKIQKELWELRAEFNLFRQDIKKNEYTNLLVRIKDVLFKRDVLFKEDVKVERNEVQYNLAPDYVELVGTSGDSVDSTSTWEDWDISALVPVNAIRAEILLSNQVDAAYVAGIRENGSALAKTNHMNNDSQYKVIVNLDSGRIIERYATNTDVVFYVTGYFI